MSKKNKTEKGDFCSFCYKLGSEVKRLLQGPAAINICNECVFLCSDILTSEKMVSSGSRKSESSKSKKTPTPKEIHKLLDEHVIGHEETKKILSVAVFNHYLRVNHPKEVGGVVLEKSNILLLGDTGTGKTLLAQTLANIVNVPFAVADATTLTEAGYVGEDVENILLKLIQSADGDPARAEKGIIFIDEIDKVSRRSENRSITRDVSGEGVQQALLKILEGTVASVPPQGGRKHPEQQNLKIDTRSILFICGGAFDGLEEIVSRRVGTTAIGFKSTEIANSLKKSLLGKVEPDDLIKYGLIPELTGRLPVFGVLDKLSKEAYFNILVEPKNAIVRQYQKMYEIMNCPLEFDKEFLHRVVEEACHLKMGARSLRRVMEKYMTPLSYLIASLPSNKKHAIRVTEDLISLGVDEFLEKSGATKKGKRSKVLDAG